MNAQTQKFEIQNRLEKLAYRRTEGFCYSCYTAAPSGRCTRCGSDDLCRLLVGVGLDWGCDWVIRELLSDALTPANVSEAFEESVRSCYDETISIGWLKDYDTVSAIQELDPVSWQLAQSEYVDQEESEGTLISFDNGGSYYWTHDVEQYLDEQESNEDEAA